MAPIDNKSSDDELDDLVRAALKTLDGEVPSGYFEGLPNRTLARLEDSSMQTTSGTSGSSSLGTESVPMGELSDSTQPQKTEREEDSGLHDIRNLAASSRSRRLSMQRLGTNPPPVDEDILASTSGSWKSIALPEPAKMVSLPDIADLPSKAEIKALEKAAKAEAKAEAKARKSRPSGEIVPPADLSASTSAPSLPAVAKVDAPMTLDEEIPAKAATEAPVFGARISGMKPAKVTPLGDAPKKKNKGVLIGSIGAVVAAAAGVVIYVAMDKKSADTASAPGVAADRASERTKAEEPLKATPTVTAIATDDDKKKDEAKGEAGAGSAAPEPEPAPITDPTPPKPAVRQAVKKPTAKPEPKKIIEVTPPPDTGKKPAPAKEPPKGKTEVKENDPDFEQLIKESGYKKKEEKPKLDKKELNATDFRKGMGAVQAKAMACYNGTEGTAMVKIFIAPSGSVTNVVVSGQFANTPVAACIIGAVKGAAFPAWDGPPASFNYSYLLAN